MNDLLTYLSYAISYLAGLVAGLNERCTGTWHLGYEDGRERILGPEYPDF